MTKKEPVILRFIFDTEEAFADIVFRDGKQATNAVNAVLKSEGGFLKLKNKERVPAIIKSERVLAVYPLSFTEEGDENSEEDEDEEMDEEGDNEDEE